LTDEDIRALWDFKSGQTATDKWRGFHSRYGTDRYYSISRVGFNSDRTQALTYVVMTCGTLCRDYTYYYLEKRSDGWEVVKRLLAGVE